MSTNLLKSYGILCDAAAFGLSLAGSGGVCNKEVEQKRAMSKARCRIATSVSYYRR